MSKISAIFCLAALAAFPVAGCNAPLISVFPHSSDETPTRRYVLSADAPAGTNAATFAFARIMVPSYLDVPQIVTRDGSEIHREEKISGASRSLAELCGRSRCVAPLLPPRKTCVRRKSRCALRSSVSTARSAGTSKSPRFTKRKLRARTCFARPFPFPRRTIARHTFTRWIPR